MGEISLNELEARADAAGIDLLQIDLDSIQLPPGDDFGIISDDEDVYQEEQMDFDYGLGNTIVVDNLPVVPKEKFDKLEGVVRKIYSQIGVIKEDGLWMPVDPDTHKTLGYCFIEYNTPQEAELAKEKTNGYKLDRAHIFAVNMIEDFNRFMKVPDEWAPPEIRPYVPGENLQNWLTDEKARDQFVIRAGSDTEVFWNDARHLKPDPVYKRAYWTESFVQWSPLGTYLATVHRQGAAVWGGASTFNRLMRYAHPQVKLIDFSPGEKYLVTYSSHEPSNPRDANRVVINIFDVRTGKAMRDFKGSADEFAIGGTGGVAGVSWPVFKWGGGKDDKYFAKIGKNMISVYEATPSMAITLNSNTTPIKQEHQHSSPPPPQQPPVVKTDPPDLLIEIAQQSPSTPKEPQFLKSINDLTNLSAAIDTFKRRYDELQNHLNFIDNAITARSNELEQKTQRLQQTQTEKAKTPSPGIVAEITKVTDSETAAAAAPATEKPEIRSLCQMMCGRGLRKYIVSNLANVEKLREEVPAALKCAPKPAKLVLDCIGRFYLQGSKAYEKESPMITGREASILVLEFFLLISDHENAMEAAVKKEAEQVAVAWRKRLISEGGVRNSGEIDAKGLLLLIGGFGIPKLFSDEDVFDLVKLSNSRQFSDLVRRSRSLVTRVTDIIEGMMKKGMKIEAVDVACIFGIEDKFPAQKLLTLILQESREPLKGRKRKGNNSPAIQLEKEAKENQLIALKSVVKFLEEHQLDPTKLLPGWQLEEKTTELEKDIADLNKKIGKLPLSKRPENVNEVTNYWKSQEIKRRRLAEKGSPLISPGVRLPDQIAASYMNGQSSYNSVMRLNGGYPGHVNNYPAGTSAMYGSSIGPFPENVLGTSASGIGLSAAYGGSAGIRRDMLVDGTRQIKGGNVPQYAWHRAGDTALNDGSVGHWHPASGLFGQSSSIEGFAGLLNSPPAVAANGSSAPDLYGFADAPSLAAKHGAASDLYGFADASTVAASQTAASNLYRFPDAVAYGSTRHTGPLPRGLGSHHSSYMR